MMSSANVGDSTAILVSKWIRYRLHSPQHKYIARDSKKQKCRCAYERSRKGMRRLDDISGKNRSGDGRKLITKIDDSAECADAFPRGDQRRNRPSHGRSRGQ